jgi:DNA-binding MarR family transcriptional regulator
MDLCSLSQLLDDLKNAEDYLKKECGLTYKEASMLCSIDTGFNEPAKLAKKLGLSPSRTSRIISSLEMKDITLREASKTDKRIICLTLSDKGNELLLKIKGTKLPIPLYLQEVIDQLKTDK